MRDVTTAGAHGVEAPVLRGGTRKDRTASTRSTRLAAVVAWAAVLGFVALALGGPLLGRSVFLGTDILTRFAPWTSAVGEPVVVQNPFIGDTIDAKAPQAVVIVEGAKDGELVEWNTWQNGGAELGALPNSGVYSPVSLPWWVLPETYAPGAQKLLEILVIAVGMSLWLRRLRLPGAAWALATLVYASSGFMVAWTGWSQTRVAAFIPLLFWGLERALDRRTWWWSVLPIGAAVGAMVLGGFPAVTAYALYAGGFYVLVRAWVVHRNLRDVVATAARSLAGLVLGALLAAWVLVPFAVTSMTVLDFEAVTTMVVPFLLGYPDGTGYWGVDDPVERFGYLGAATVVLAAVALVGRSRLRVDRSVLWFAAAGFGLCFVLVYVGGPALALAQRLPVFSSNPVGRLVVLVGLFGAVLAAYGLAVVLRPVPVVRQVRDAWAAGPVAFGWLMVRVVAVATAGLLLALHVRTILRASPFVDRARAEVIDALLLVAVAVLVAVVVWLLGNRRLAAAGACVLAVLVAVPAAQVGREWWPRTDPDLFYPTTSTHRFLAERLGPDRYATSGSTMAPGTSTYYGLRSFGGHAFMTTEWKDLQAAVDPVGLRSATYSVLMPDTLAESIQNPILDRMAVRYVVARPDSPALGTVEPGAAPAGTVTLAPGTTLRSGVFTGPVRGLQLTVEGAPALGPEGTSVTVVVRDAATGAEITTTRTWVGSLGGAYSASLTGEDIAGDQQWQAELSFEGGSVPVDVATDGQGALAVSLVRPAEDDLRVVSTGDATVYERLGAMSHARWAPQATVIEDPAARVAAMSKGRVGRDTVVLEESADATGSGGTPGGEAVELDDDPDEDRVRVETDGPGWVVLAESMRRPGWTATLDGEEVEILAAEHAGGAVYVPEGGRHEIRFTYNAPGRTAGVWLTLGTVAALVVAGAVSRVRRSQRGPDRAVAAPTT